MSEISLLKNKLLAPEPVKPAGEATLTERVKQIEERERRVAKAAWWSDVETAAREAKVSNIKGLRRFLEPEYDEKLEYDGKETVQFKDEYGRKVEPAQLVADFLKTPDGEHYKVSPAMTGLPKGGAPGTTGQKEFRELTNEELRKSSPEQRESHRLEVLKNLRSGK